MLFWAVAFFSALSSAIAVESEEFIPSIRMVGGHDAPKDQYTYTASIQEGGYQICTASILCDKYILTAAHCCQSNPADFYVTVGNHNRTQGVKHMIAKWVPHEEYGGLGEGHLLNDICIGVLNDTITFNRHTRRVALPITPASVPDGTTSTVIGWGYDDRGDSGGPLVKVSRGIDVQIGVFSYYYGNCGTPYPDIYTNVTHYADWIISHVENPSCLKFFPLV